MMQQQAVVVHHQSLPLYVLALRQVTYLAIMMIVLTPSSVSVAVQLVRPWALQPCCSTAHRQGRPCCVASCRCH
jgi:hypothetical protein